MNNLLELGCVFLNPYEVYVPEDGNHPTYRYNIENFYSQCFCVPNHYDKTMNFRLDSQGVQGNLGRAIIKAWTAAVRNKLPNVSKTAVKEDEIAIKVYDNKLDAVLYIGWFNKELTVTTYPPTRMGKLIK